jgi:hypothetical protein
VLPPLEQIVPRMHNDARRSTASAAHLEALQQRKDQRA